MKTLTKKDTAYLVIGEWFDKTDGNTYFDLTFEINGKVYEVPYTYGYDSNNAYVIKSGLESIGFRLRKDKRVQDYIKVYVKSKLKRELNK